MATILGDCEFFSCDSRIPNCLFSELPPFLFLEIDIGSIFNRNRHQALSVAPHSITVLPGNVGLATINTRHVQNRFLLILM